MSPLIYAIKTYKYRSSLRNLIRKLLIFFIYENVRKKLLVVVPQRPALYAKVF